MRRLDIASPADAYERLQRGALRYADVPEAELRRLERERPELIVTDGEAALACVPRPSLLYELGYAFPDRDAFVRTFPELFRRVLQAADPDEGPLGFRLTLTEAPSRPYVEPVLFAHAFEVAREWIRMEL
ncbi:MAG: hypothetical protein U1B78_00295, partial [Dehalococcoidia bacterium]|nr:hypothetical protein [Dehalococcoidia bacterium]